jgi:hypothetical protein
MLDPVDESALAQRLAAALAAESLPRERRGKTYNLRPLMEELSILPAALPASSPSRGRLRVVSRIEPREVQAETQELRVFMRLAARAGATARPEEVLDVLGIPLESARIARTRLILNRDME